MIKKNFNFTIEDPCAYTSLENFGVTLSNCTNTTYIRSQMMGVLP